MTSPTKVAPGLFYRSDANPGPYKKGDRVIGRSKSDALAGVYVVIEVVPNPQRPGETSMTLKSELTGTKVITGNSSKWYKKVDAK